MRARFKQFFHRLNRHLTLCALGAALIAALNPAPARALSLIRDAEIEATLRTYADPIFEAAGLSPSAIQIFIINDDSINAFVAGGANLFIHTGLILATPNPGMLLGVMAHETGHIAGGHLAQGAEKLKNAQLGVILSTVLGAAAAASGSGDAGMAIMTIGQQTALRNLLSFSRSNEQAADQAALTYLDHLHLSADGMLKMFETLRRQETRQFGTPDPYTRTHPLSKERIAHIRAHVERSSIAEDSVPAGYAALHTRMLAKLSAFIKPPEQTLKRYPMRDASLEARYARAVAYYRVPDVPKALAELDSLLKEHPKDPYFHELKGQILFEHGRIEEALTAYEKALSLQPNAALIRFDLAKVQLASKKPGMRDAAIRNLERATSQDNTNAAGWRLLATAYGEAEKPGLSHLALAEEAYLMNKPDLVKIEVTEALKHLPADSPARLRAGDLTLIAEKMKADREKE